MKQFLINIIKVLPLFFAGVLGMMSWIGVNGQIPVVDGFDYPIRDNSGTIRIMDYNPTSESEVDIFNSKTINNWSGINCFGTSSSPCNGMWGGMDITNPHGNLHLGEDWGEYHWIDENGDGSLDTEGDALGQTVHAIANGRVIYSNKIKANGAVDNICWLNIVMIHHQRESGDEFISIYGHLTANNLVVCGTEVYRGQKIGEIGSPICLESSTPKPHLHIEIIEKASFDSNKWNLRPNCPIIEIDMGPNNFLNDGYQSPIPAGYLSSHELIASDRPNYNDSGNFHTFSDPDITTLVCDKNALTTNAWYIAYLKTLAEVNCTGNFTNSFEDVTNTSITNTGNPTNGFEGLSNPTSGTYFFPQRPVTRMEMAKSVAKAALSIPGLISELNLNGHEISDCSNDANIFNDVPVNHPYFPWIQLLRENNIIKGYGCTNNFHPNDFVNREQMCKFMVNAFNIPTPTFADINDFMNSTDIMEDIKADISLLGWENSELLGFCTDPNTIPINISSEVEENLNTDYSLIPYIITLYKQGSRRNTKNNGSGTNGYQDDPSTFDVCLGQDYDHIVKGLGANFEPKDTVTREQMVKFLLNSYHNCLYRNVNIVPTTSGMAAKGNSPKKSALTVNSYSILGHNFEQSGPVNGTLYSNAIFTDGSSGTTKTIYDDQTVTIQHPSNYDVDGDQLFFYWVAENGTLTETSGSLDYRKVTFTPPSVSSTTDFQIFTLAGDGNGNVTTKFFTITVQPNSTGGNNGNSSQGSVIVTPQTINYGTLTVGTSETEYFTVNNQSNSNVSASLGFSNNGTNAFNFPGGSINLAPGDEVSIPITFIPNAAGNYQAYFNINYDDGSTDQISLQGNGAGTQLGMQVNPTSINWGSQQIGTCSTMTYTISNPASSTTNLQGSISLSGAVNGSFNAIQLGDFSVPPGNTISADVEFCPSAVGSYGETINILPDDSSVPSQSISLQGDGIAQNGCTGGSQWPSNLQIPNANYQTIEYTYGGEYSKHYVESGEEYQWTFCSNGGNAPFDSELTLLNSNGSSVIDYSNDVCGDDAEINWTANFTGNVRVLVTNYNCQNNNSYSDYGTLAFRQTSAPPPPSASPILVSPAHNTTNMSASGFIYLEWDPVQDADYYHLQVSTDSDWDGIYNGLANPNVLDLDVFNGTTQFLNPEPNTEYFWTVTAVNEGGSGPYASRFRFTTGGTSTSGACNISGGYQFPSSDPFTGGDGILTPENYWYPSGCYLANDYTLFNVVQGEKYVWSFCPSDGTPTEGYGNASFDSQLTLTDNNTGQILAFADDECGDDARLEWEATFTGTVRIRPTKKSCDTNFGGTGDCTVLVYRLLGPPTESPNLQIPINFSQEVDSSEPIYFQWSGVDDATGYILQISVNNGYDIDEGLSNPIFEITLGDQTTYNWTGGSSYGNGYFFWTVAAINDAGTGEFHVPSFRFNTKINGCINANACNFEPNANTNDNSCIFEDCEGNCGGSATTGAACNDGDSTTTGDTYDSNCNCIGTATYGCNNPNACNYDVNATADNGTCTYLDCEGNCGGNATTGTPCDDGNPTTTGDTYDANCNCVGTIIYGCTNTSACNYNATATSDDGNCNLPDCEGNCSGISSGSAQPGTACNDGLSNTVNDEWDNNCICTGIEIPGCIESAACNYDSNATVNDGSCNYPDCEGNCNNNDSGLSLTGTSCNDGDSTTTNDIWDANCNCVGTPNSACSNLPDLVVTDLIVNSYSSSSIQYSYTISNIGTAPANLDGPTSAQHDNLKVQAFVSSDQIFNNSGDVTAGGSIVGVSPLGNLDPGESLSGNLNPGFDLDTSTHPYLILMVDWGEITDECNESNNTYYVLIEETCIDIINITNNVANGALDEQHAGDQLTASNEIFAGGTAIYKAENQVRLTNGFKAHANSSGHFYIEVCQTTNARPSSKEEIVYEIVEPSEINSKEVGNKKVVEVEKPKYIEGISNLSLFPNPASTDFNIRFNLKDATTVYVRILNQTGQTVGENEFDGIQGFNQFQFDSANLPNGIYMVELLTESERIVERVEIIH